MKRTLDVTVDHLKLLRAMYVDWNDCEFGAPAVDPKRPYGNSDVYGDIAEILDIKSNDEDDPSHFSDEQTDYMDRIHRDMAVILQILISNLGVVTGRYQLTREYGKDWVIVPGTK